MKNLNRIIIIATLILSLSACGWLSGAGNSVQAVGNGAAHALSVTGGAISNAATETENRID